MNVLVDAVACATLLFVAVDDAKRFRIRNDAVLVLFGLFGLGAWTSGMGHDVVWHGVFAGLVLILMFGAFAFSFVGAGDAKLMTACSLWVGPENALLFALVLFGLTGLYGLGAKLEILPTRRDDRGIKIPYGPSISIACFLTITLS